jgi:hypothetical protein
MADDVVDDGEIVIENDDDESDDDESDESDDDESGSEPCEMCGEKDDPDRTLLCDKCNGAFHMECLDPPLTDVPDGEWLCPQCTDPEQWAKIMALQEKEQVLFTLLVTDHPEYECWTKRVTDADREADDLKKNALEIQKTLLKVVGVTQSLDADGSTSEHRYWALHKQETWPEPLVAKLLEYKEFPPKVLNLFSNMKELQETYLAFEEKKTFIKEILENMSNNPWLNDFKSTQELVEDLRKTIVDLQNDINKKDGKRPAPHDEAASDGAVRNEGNAALALCFGLKTHGEGPSQSKKRPASPAPHGEGSSKHTKINGDEDKLPAPHGEGSSPRTGPWMNNIFDEIPPVIPVDLTLDSDSE